MLRTTAVMSGVQGTPYYQQFHWGGDTAGEAAAAADAHEAFYNQLVNFLTAGLSILVQSEVEQVDPATGQIVAVYPATTATAVCAGAGEMLPWATQGLIRLRTGQFANGREIRGRVFVPGWLESSSTAGKPISAVLNAQNTAINAALTAGSAAGNLGVYSPTHRQFAQVTSTSSWSEWAVLRSRRS